MTRTKSPIRITRPKIDDANSEPKIGELLENFDVHVSAGSLSNILTNTASDFEQEYVLFVTLAVAVWLLSRTEQ